MRRFLWIAFLVLDALVLCLFMAGYVARWVHPETVWWPQLFAIALPFFSILILFATPVWGIVRRWVMFGLHLVFVLLIAIRFVAFSQLADMPAEETATLRLASYNLGHFELFSQAEQAKRLGEVLGLLYPDIIGLQEFLVRYKGRELRIRNLPYVANKLDSLGYQTVAVNVHDVPSTFKPVWTRREKLVQKEKQRIKLEEPGHAVMSVTRMVFEWNGQEAVYYNVHLRTFGSKKPWLDDSMSPLTPEFWIFYLNQYKEAFIDRAWEAGKIKELVDAETLPVVVAGDFNSTPHNWAYYHLAKDMRDVHKVAGIIWKTSYHVDFPLAQIDHMLVSPEWDVYQAAIPPLDYSDHKPVVATLGWKEN